MEALSETGINIYSSFSGLAVKLMQVNIPLALRPPHNLTGLVFMYFVKVMTLSLNIRPPQKLPLQCGEGRHILCVRVRARVRVRVRGGSHKCRWVS